MGKKRPEPLLPVHSRHMPKRSRKRGSCMRIVIMVAIFCTIGYAAFATRYIGTSKARKDARDSLVRTQLERKSVIPSSVGVQNEGRSLKADPKLAGSRTRDLGINPNRKRADLGSDAAIGDDGAYDDVVARDTSTGGGAGRGASPAKRVTDDAQRQQEAQAPRVAPRLAPQTVNSPTHDPQPHVAPLDRHTVEPQSQARAPQQPQLQPLHDAGSSAHRPVTAGAVEADSHTDAKATVTAPSVSVGSRIESDRSVEDRAHNVAEPGAKPISHAVIEPAAHTPAVVQAPIPVVHTEPDSSAHKGPEVRAPVLLGPIETDSTTQSVPVKAPEDRPVTSPVHAPGAPGTPGVGGTPAVNTQQAVPQSTPAPVVHAPNSNTAPNRSPLAKGLYALEAVDIDGKTRPLSEFAGKVTLVVNVASACGYTDENYKGLMKTYEKYRNHGFEILGFPCNQFGKQEPGSEAEIKGFCSSRYHVTFPMFSKLDVNGPDTHPVYQFLKRELPESEGGGGGKGPGKDLIWNFQKILVNHEGRPIKLFYQQWDQGAVEQEIYRLLHEARAASRAATQ